MSGVEDALLGPIGPLIAFIVGTVSFFSPCVLPLLPGYLSYMGGVGGQELAAQPGQGRKRLIFATLLFILGFTVIFAALGASASALGSVLTRNLKAITRIAGVIVIVMGMAFILPRLFPFLEREKRPFLKSVKPGMAGAFPLGMAFGAGWTPCVGPGLGVILTLAANEGSVVRGTLLLIFFSLGFGLWFLLASLGAERILRGSFFKRNLRKIQVVGGTFMVAIGILLVTDLWTSLMAPILRWSNNFVPAI
ncbi:MAG: cytochrome c biogenesis CcdA family protein [Actinomycetota bacterium]